MNKHIQSIYEMASRDHRYVIGLMSGTSLDGLDLAYCKISNSGRQTQVEVIAFDTIDYDDHTKEKIRKVFAKSTVDFAYLAMLNEWIGTFHGKLVNQFIAQHQINKEHIDVIASHGQTVMHVPKHQHQNPIFPNATLQIGDGDHIAKKTGFITISDFRQKHVAAGGEGAPLAVYGDYLIFTSTKEDRIMLNMGGIGNFTYLPKDGDASRVFVTDTGPGNTLMDAYMKMKLNMAYDQDAATASKGSVNQSLLSAMKEHYFFNLDFPKTTGPEVFNFDMVQKALQNCEINDISHEDMMATLNRLSAETITEAILKVIGDQSFHIYLSGGGAHNPLMLKSMKSLLPNCTFNLCDTLGISGDAKEAILFAVLANETLAGNPINFGGRQGVPAVCMGKISFPD